jgi:hypothetical protein
LRHPAREFMKARLSEHRKWRHWGPSHLPTCRLSDLGGHHSARLSRLDDTHRTAAQFWRHQDFRYRGCSKIAATRRRALVSGGDPLHRRSHAPLADRADIWRRRLYVKVP